MLSGHFRIVLIAVMAALVVTIAVLFGVATNGTDFANWFAGEEPPPEPSAVADPRVNGWLRVQGNRIVDEQGRAVMLRGANVENWQWVWGSVSDKSEALSFERRAIPKLTGEPPDGWGANLLHIDIATVPFIEGNQEYIDAVDEMVALAKDNGAYTLVSLRYEDLLDEPTSPTQTIVDSGAVIAEHYKDEPAVILVAGSEPRGVTWQELKPVVTDIIDSIRSRNPNAMIGVPGTEWSRYVYENLDDPIGRANLFFHVSAFDTWEIITKGDGNYLGPYKLDEVAKRYPVILGGFGPRAEPIPGEDFWMSDLDDLVSLMNFAERHYIGWTPWLFNDRSCPCLLSDADTFDTTPFGDEIKRRLQAAPDTLVP